MRPLLHKLDDRFYTQWLGNDRGFTIVRKSDGRTWRDVGHFGWSENSGRHRTNRYEQAHINSMQNKVILVKGI